MSIQGVVEQSTDEPTTSEEVVSAVAEVRGVDPMDLDPLYETVDPDALDALFDRDGPDRLGSPDRIEFTYGGCQVVICGDGTVAATELPPTRA